MPLVAESTKRVRAKTSFNNFSALWLFAAHVIHLNRITTGQPDQHEFVVGSTKHVGRNGAGFGTPLDGLGG